MSSRIFCDGCGTEIEVGKHNHLQVATASHHTNEHTVQNYELCGECIGTARFYFNPTLWPRNVRSCANHTI